MKDEEGKVVDFNAKEEKKSAKGPRQKTAEGLDAGER